MAKSLVEYFDIHQEWEEELTILRTILLDLELPEVLKWGIPNYTVNGKNVIGLAAFKAYVGLWFHQGAFLSDESRVLVNAQEGKTKGMRQWRFSSKDDIDKDLVKAYILEAIENQKLGKEIKPTRSKSYELTEPLKTLLKEDNQFYERFYALNFSNQKDYANYITAAKQEATKEKRLLKIAPMIMAGEGLNDKYKK